MLLLPCFLNMADMSKFPFLSTGNFCLGGIADWLCAHGCQKTPGETNESQLKKTLHTCSLNSTPGRYIS